ncbi:hypothetical protein [Ralstonia phage RP31]|uniref:Uncharacterized protein n=2 Tax=Ripduovirus RP12 TaxID=2560700 RepID=A0A1L7N148_9CAUD|nr:hypothetical protein FDH28_gp195 [Ralstonia phage RP12]BAW19200.1 hypothetical protein [Ralstonia phage RP12]BAW19486.1 hypothetical protein [Ralstonia phage RP31]
MKKYVKAAKQVGAFVGAILAILLLNGLTVHWDEEAKAKEAEAAKQAIPVRYHI